MQYISTTESPDVLIVCCQHGDEYFGQTVFDFYKDSLEEMPGLALLLANEPAIKADKRYLETDLNRSYPGNPEGSKEEQLAATILSHAKRARFVLDIHNTSTDITFVPIITNLSEDTKSILNHCAGTEIAHIDKPMSDVSLIGQLSAGVSLEFNYAFSETPEGMRIVDDIVQGLLKQSVAQPKSREIYFINDVIKKKIKIPKDIQNYKLIEPLGVYPFLFGEKSYHDIHGLAAYKKEQILL